MQIKVITWNIWQGRFLPKVLEFLQVEKPDVVLLQEAAGKGGGGFSGVTFDSYEAIRSTLGFEGIFAPMLTIKSALGEYELGVAVLSRFEMMGSYDEFYSNNRVEIEELVEVRKSWPGRLAAIKVKAGDGEVWLGATHFPWSLYPEETEVQKKAADNFVAQLADKERLILGGDFNLTDQTETYRKITAVMKDDRPADVESTIHPTIHKVGRELKVAIDFLFHKGEGIELLESRVPMSDGSDHLPVVGIYQLT